jgi:hypothetical protein
METLTPSEWRALRLLVRLNRVRSRSMPPSHHRTRSAWYRLVNLKLAGFGRAIDSPDPRPIDDYSTFFATHASIDALRSAGRIDTSEPPR